MADFVNQRFFDKDFSFQKAIGRDLKSHFTSLEKGTAAEQSGGIVAPERVEIAVGSTIVRFASSDYCLSAIAGEWWLRWQDYQPLERLADLNRLPVATVVRRKCIVPPEWSNMAFILQARVTAPLLAWGGLGRPAKSSSEGLMTGADLGGGPAFQLLIPGLGNGDIRHDALAVQGYAFLDPASTTRGFIRQVPGWNLSG
jgi:hypothetical protein